MPSTYVDPFAHGYKTRRVREIIEELREELGRLPKYREVAERYSSEGGNENTAKTQYAIWKRENPSSRETNPNDMTDQPTPEALGSDISGDCEPIPLSVDSHGHLMLPREIRAAMQLGPDGRVTARVENGELRVVSPQAAIRRAQEIARRLKKPGESVVDEFLAERRAEWSEDA